MNSNENFNRWLSRKYLDLAARLPKLNISILTELQNIQQIRQRDANEAYKDNKPPNDTTIDLLAFTMFEMFTIEDFENIPSAIINLFSKLPDNIKRTELIPSIKRVVERSSSTSTILGTLYREHTRLHVYCAMHMPNLPTEVEFINLYLHRISSRIIVLTAEVYINDSFIEKINFNRNNKHLPEIIFERKGLFINPLNYYTIEPELILRDITIRIIDNLRFKLEKNLNSIFCGFFNKNSLHSLYKQPIIEKYLLSDFPSNISGNKSHTSYARWLISYGIDITLNLFSNEKYMFVINQTDNFINPDAENRYSFKIIVNENHIPSNKFGHSNKRDISFLDNKEYIGELIFLIISTSFIEIIKEDILNTSKIINNLEGRNIAKFSINRKKSIKKYTKTNRDIYKKYSLLTMMIDELDKYKINVNLESDKYFLKLKYNSIGSEYIKENLYIRFLSVSDNQFKFILGQLNYIKELLTNSINIINIETSYNLQKWAIILAVISVLISIHLQKWAIILAVIGLLEHLWNKLMNE